MKEFPSYRLENIFTEAFSSSQYFALLELVREEYEMQKQQQEKAQKASEKKSKK